MNQRFNLCRLNFVQLCISGIAEQFHFLDLHSSGPMQGLLIQQAKELGLDVKLIGSFGTENAILLRDYGNISNGLTYSYSYDSESDEDGVKAFVDAYENRYGEIPDLVAANSYDALKILSIAINNVGENSTNIKTHLLSVKDYEGAGGKFSFDENGDVKRDINNKAAS